MERCDEESVTLITKNILNKSAELVSVNCYRAYNLFKKYIPNEEKNIIFSLQNHPKLGIEYFQHYIKSHRKEENFHLETDLGTIYAELLIKENKFEKVFFLFLIYFYYRQNSLMKR